MTHANHVSSGKIEFCTSDPYRGFRTELLAEGLRLLQAREALRRQVGIGIQQADRDELIDHDTVFANLRNQAALIQEANSRQ